MTKTPPTPERLIRRAMRQTLGAVRLTRRAYEGDGEPEDLEEARKLLSAGYALLNRARAKREEMADVTEEKQEAAS